MEKLSGLIVPTETELNLDGFFLGQLVCPKRDHIARWNVAKVSFLSRLDLSIGPVLNLVDIQTGSIYQELPGYVDFLASKPIQDNENLHFGQLICPICLDVGWAIGSAQGMLDCSGADEYIIFELGTKKRFTGKKGRLSKIIRVEASFPKLADLK